MRKRATKRRKSKQNKKRRRNTNKNRILGGMFTIQQIIAREAAVARNYRQTMDALISIRNNDNSPREDKQKADVRINYLLNWGFIDYINYQLRAERPIREITRFIQNYRHLNRDIQNFIGVDPRPTLEFDADPWAHRTYDTDTAGENQEPPEGWPFNPVVPVTPSANPLGGDWPEEPRFNDE